MKHFVIQINLTFENVACDNACDNDALIISNNLTL